ncbi:sulfite exporter TauE/SafE family protein [Roseomonas populi]|uniref:Probable membrane transporter protein n=1 Tax=Roseomonas populi TaxID=3121582 RepID=A0ABT1X993_9PROT|nr:sulfite exporter TauE/SafE family protein [Roseomonas pecuniae]MCR0983702.1 sulfite exporter TauE/SafE family protein [Roseomonas pecuniae]
MPDITYAASGLGVGLLVGLTGVGGGSLMTPLLILLFGVHPASAVGSDLLYAASTKAVGTAVHGLHGSVGWRIVGLLAAGSVPATAFTILLAAYLGIGGGGRSHFIAVALGIVLLLTAAVMLCQKQVVAAVSGLLGRTGRVNTPALTVLVGAMLGVMVTLTSVGAGAIGMTALLILYPKLPAVRLVGSDIAHAVPLTLLAGFGHWWLGTVDFGLVGSLLAGSIPGIILGSLLSNRVPERSLRVCLALVLTAVAFTLIL